MGRGLVLGLAAYEMFSILPCSGLPALWPSRDCDLLTELGLALDQSSLQVLRSGLSDLGPKSPGLLLLLWFPGEAMLPFHSPWVEEVGCMVCPHQGMYWKLQKGRDFSMKQGPCPCDRSRFLASSVSFHLEWGCHFNSQAVF